MGICKNCGAETTGKKRNGEHYMMCAKCREYFRELAQKRRKRLKEENCCIQCAIPLKEGEVKWCSRCRIRQAQKLEAYRQKYQNICHRCGATVGEINPNTDKPYTYCKECRKIMNEYYRKKKEEKNGKM